MDYTSRLSRLLNPWALGQPVFREEDVKDDGKEHIENVGGHQHNVRKAKDDHIKIPLPDIRQSEDYSCGAAALRSIFEYYGIWDEDEDAYIDALRSTPDNGTPPSAIKRVAQAAGLHVLEMHGMTTDELKALMDQKKPVVCYMQAWGESEEYEREEEEGPKSGHVVAAIGYDDSSNIYFMDPAIDSNRGYMAEPELNDRWYDEDASGKPYERYGIAIWLQSNDVRTSQVRQAKEIE